MCGTREDELGNGFVSGVTLALPEQLLTYFQLVLVEQTSVKILVKIQTFFNKKFI